MLNLFFDGILGFVEEVIENSGVAYVRLFELKVRLKIDQDQLETVIPQVGKPVVILKGPYRGTCGTLISFDQEKFSVVVELQEKNSENFIKLNYGFDDVSKLYSPV